MFPSGLPGLGLVFLRFAIAVSVAWMDVSFSANTLPTWFGLPLELVAIGVCLGVWTPYLAVLTCAIEGFLLIRIFSNCWFVVVPGLLCSTALAMVGPGAYSIDNVMFGRRRIRPSNDPS